MNPVGRAGKRGDLWIHIKLLVYGRRFFLETATQLADYFLQELPEDLICYWDLIFKEGSQEEKIALRQQ